MGRGEGALGMEGAQELKATMLNTGAQGARMEEL